MRKRVRERESEADIERERVRERENRREGRSEGLLGKGIMFYAVLDLLFWRRIQAMGNHTT